MFQEETRSPDWRWESGLLIGGEVRESNKNRSDLRGLRSLDPQQLERL